jgi:NodT family efflux transporter outer membrane factor (OMF) lipoprotein
MKAMNVRYFSILLAIFAGCAVGPNYQPPENVINDAWQKPEEGISVDEPIVAWWTLFNDPMLTRYIEMAAQNNKDLAQAEAAILQARAMRDVAASKFFPQITTDLSAIKTYFSKNGPVYSAAPGGGAGGGITSPTTGLPFSVQIPQIQNLYTALFDANWEIDLFGKTRRTVESAQAHVESTIEKRNDTLISVLAEVARNFIELRGFQMQASYYEDNIRLLEQNREIVCDQYQTGLANQLDLDNIEAALANARAELPEVIANIYRSIYTLSLLTGNVPEALVDDLLPSAHLPRRPDIVSVGLRSDLLRRRPDVRQAERELAESTADVGVAVASFYPTFTLLGDAGLQSLQVKNLFQSASKTWAYGGDFNSPIYEGGKLTGNLRAAKAAETVAFSRYQQTVLAALQNTESALIAYCEDIKTITLQQESVDRYQKIVDLTSDRYKTGLINLINLIDAKRQLISASELLLKNDTAALIDLIALYKALGGGWQPEDQTELQSHESN